MRIAVLVSGQPRFIEAGAKWMTERVFSNLHGYKIDYYCHFWDNGDPELEKKIVSTYNPVKFKIENYKDSIQDFKRQVIEKNQYNKDDFKLVPKYIRENILFDTHEVTEYGMNFWGQFLSTYEVSGLANYDQYDIVIKTRSDAVLHPMNHTVWSKALANIKRNPSFNTRIFAPWLQVVGGMPYFCDFAFIATPEAWKNYSMYLRDNCLKLATQDKALFYEFNIHEFHGIAHWVWNKLSIYSMSSFLSFSVTWPMNFDACLIRTSDDISKLEYQKVHQIFVESG